MSNNYYKYDFLRVLLFVIVLVLFVVLFAGSPDLMDAIINRVNCTK